MKVASFFSGIGGFDLGLERAGMEVVFQSEKKEYCRQVLRRHWPDVTLNDDINDLSASDIPQTDLWCAGFPCQDVSLANQGKRQGLYGKRTGLFFKFAELLEQHRPKWIILENVPGLLNSNNGEDFREVIRTLDELGYGVSWRVFDAKYFGTPQRRRRVFIVGSLGNIGSGRVLFDAGANPILDKQGIGKKNRHAKGVQKGIGESTFYAIQHATIGRKPEAGPQAKGYRNDEETYTLDSRGSSDAVCSTNDAFGIRAASGISDRMDGNRYRAIGNAVCVNIIEVIGNRIMEVESDRVDGDIKEKQLADQDL